MLIWRQRLKAKVVRNPRPKIVRHLSSKVAVFKSFKTAGKFLALFIGYVH